MLEQAIPYEDSKFAMDQKVVHLFIAWITKNTPVWVKTIVRILLLHNIQDVDAPMNDEPDKKLSFFEDCRLPKVPEMMNFEASDT